LTGLGAVEDHLVSVAQHLLHGLEVHALRGHVFVGQVGLIDRLEALGVALRAVGHLLAVGLRLLDQAFGVTAGARNDVVAIGLRLVAQPLAIGTGALHVVERVDHLGGGINCTRRTSMPAP